MPFKSQAQRRKFHAMANRGEISKQTVEHWESATGDKKLPERVGRKKESQFFGHGVAQAMTDVGLVH